MDLAGWAQLLEQTEDGRVTLHAFDSREPSPFSHELLNANPCAFLDDAPLEERRSRAVATHRSLDDQTLADLGRLDPQAIEPVREEARPVVRDCNELHDALMSLVALPQRDAGPWSTWFDELVDGGRAAAVRRREQPTLWIAAEHAPLMRVLLPEADVEPPIVLPAKLTVSAGPADAADRLVRGHTEVCGPTTCAALASKLGLESQVVEAALTRLEASGAVLRGRYTDDPDQLAGADAPAPPQWCDRRLLARIHRATILNLLARIQPVETRHYLRFVLRHQRVSDAARWRGRDGLLEVLRQLQCFELPAGCWESRVLPTRVEGCQKAWLDELTLCGEVVWGRFAAPARSDDTLGRATMHRMIPVSFVLSDQLAKLVNPTGTKPRLRSDAAAVLEALETRGALFATDLNSITGLLPAQVDAALFELTAQGLVTADCFAAIRALVAPAHERTAMRGRRRRGRPPAGGRWSTLAAATPFDNDESKRPEAWARLLLQRYGVVCRDWLERERLAPTWPQLVATFRTLESRGEVRGGRFTAGVAGEQFALEGAVEQLRALRDDEDPVNNDQTVLSAADPIHVAAALRPAPRVTASHGSALLPRHGRLITSTQAGRTTVHDQQTQEDEQKLTTMLQAGV